MKRTVYIILLLLLTAGSALAIGPHEVAVLANRNSAKSVLVATEYARLRRIPDCNIIYVNVPDKFVKPDPSISPRNFNKYIWKPAAGTIRKRGIGNHILVWAYSIDFPIRITTDPPMSIQGITFLRGEVPDMEQVAKGTYVSPLFAGPEGPTARLFPSQSFDVISKWLGPDMPLPSMMLGYAGARGNDMDTILRCLKTGTESDGTAPDGSVYYVEGTDVRAKARQPQFPRAMQDLKRMGINAEIVKKPGPAQSPILGLMMGLAVVKPAAYGSYAPGAFCDHLTSAAGIFDSDFQTKLTKWIEAGATASAGAVTEPRAIWMKFPNAQIFWHQAAGCTMIESLYQSVKCPMQLLMVGEPLANPRGPTARMTLDGLPSRVSGRVDFKAAVATSASATYSIYACLIDGRPVDLSSTAAGSNRFRLELDTSVIADGQHSLRVIARSGGTIRHQVFAERVITVTRLP